MKTSGRNGHPSPSAFTKPEQAWIAYDIGDSAFALIVWTTVMPVFFKEYAAGSLPGSVSTSYWGFANAAATLVMSVLCLTLGAVADRRAQKKTVFLVFWGFGLAATVMLAWTPANGWLYALLVFSLARIGWGGSLFLYDAFLPDVTTKNRMDRVSSAGYTAGYIGSVVPFLAVIALFLWQKGRVIPAAVAPMFLLVAVWWALFSLPLLRTVRQQYYRDSSSIAGTVFWRRLLLLFQEMKKDPSLFRFLLAYFCYIDGVDTLISMSTAYGVDVGLQPATLLLAVLMIQLVAFPCTWVYGRLSDRFSSFILIRVGIAVYGLVALLAFFLPDIRNPATRTLLFWVLAFLTATSLGGIQALSRSAFARMIPPQRSAEFFSVYNILGRFAAIFGPFMMALGARWFGHARWGILGVMLLFLAGYLLLPDGKRPPLKV